MCVLSITVPIRKKSGNLFNDPRVYIYIYIYIYITKEVSKAIYKEGLEIQLAHSSPSLGQYLTKKNPNTIAICTLADCLIRKPNIFQKVYTIYRLIYLKFHNFYKESIIRPLHIRIKKHLNTYASLFHKHLIKCKNKDNNFPLKIEAIVCNVGNLRIKEASD